MSNLPEVPTDELLSFHDYPTVHSVPNQDSAQLNIGVPELQQQAVPHPDESPNEDAGETPSSKSFWTLEYYQKFFDVDTTDVKERILASIIPQRDSALKRHLKEKPDLYGPFWITLTLIFTIAISGNIANYLQYASKQKYQWKYDFHLVSYAATAIYCYVLLVPFALWAVLKWSNDTPDLDDLEENSRPSTLELICIYGYSLFIYIPVSIFWTIPIEFVQWVLVIVAASISGSVLLFTLLPALRLSRHKLFIILGIIACHFLLAVGFMLYFFHVPNMVVVDNQKNDTNKV